MNVIYINGNLKMLFPMFFFPLAKLFLVAAVAAAQATDAEEVSLRDLLGRGIGAPTPGQFACENIQSILGSTIVQDRGTAEYMTTTNDAFNLDNARLQPECIVYPTAAVHVQQAMRAIFHANSRYAVQAGGHSAMKGWNSVQDGVLISFSQMTNVSYDAVGGTITLQPGIRWGEAVTDLQAQGVAPVGGRMGDVGTGLLLGGGISFLSPSHGFSADSVLEADVVLVSGELVTANATNQYADLFRALKGGGNRFGIVTRYVVEAIKTGTADDKFWYGGTIYYPETSFEALAQATSEYVATVTDPNAVLLVSLLSTTAPILPIFPPGPSKLGMVNAFYRSSTNSTPTSLPEDIYGSFLSIPSSLQQLGPLSYLDISAILGVGNSSSPRGFIQQYGASALAPEQNVYLDALTHWLNFTDTFIASADSSIAMAVLAFTPVLQNQIEYGRARGGNAINPPDGPYSAVQISEQFSPGVDVVSTDILDGIQLLFKQIPPSQGKPLFLNECQLDQDVYDSYSSGTGKAFLEKVYKKYDPTRFNIHHVDGPNGL